ncbi:MAG: nucleotidyltransferase domain-containing protein [Firmicutes bacterium]|nr:nucleotidyltransferase domain-containing protein [Candidatus Fermentithermobacillaceae bacterium]
MNIEPQIGALVRYLEAQDDILAAYLYGSYGTAHQTALSDVDLALLFYRERRSDVRRFLSLEADIVSVHHRLHNDLVERPRRQTGKVGR